jgi:hypothetical protein
MRAVIVKKGEFDFNFKYNSFIKYQTLRLASASLSTSLRLKGGAVRKLILTI